MARSGDTDLAKLPLDQLRTLVVLVEAGSLVAAARRLGVTQPAVSNQLSRLEASLPFPLFTPGAARKTLTRSGQLLYEAIRHDMTSLTSALRHVALLHASPAELELRLAGRREVIARLAPRLRFAGRLRFLPMTGDEALAALGRRECDAAVLLRQPPEDQGLRQTPLFTQGACVAVHRSLLGRRKLTLGLATSAAFLRGVPCLAYRERPPFLTELAARAGLTPRDLDVRRTCEDWLAIAGMVGAAQGFAAMPEDLPLAPDVETVALPPEVVPPVTFHLVYAAHYADVPALRSLVESMKSAT